MSEQVAGINISDYPEKKEKGLITIAKVGDAYALAVKVFNPETGVEASPQIYGMAIEELRAQKEQLLKSANDIQFLITDFEVLK